MHRLAPFGRVELCAPPPSNDLAGPRGVEGRGVSGCVVCVWVRRGLSCAVLWRLVCVCVCAAGVCVPQGGARMCVCVCVSSVVKRLVEVIVDCRRLSYTCENQWRVEVAVCVCVCV